MRNQMEVGVRRREKLGEATPSFSLQYQVWHQKVLQG